MTARDPLRHGGYQRKTCLTKKVSKTSTASNIKMNEEEDLADLVYKTSKTATARAATAKKKKRMTTAVSASTGRRTSTRKRSSVTQDDEAPIDRPTKKRKKRAVSKKDNFPDNSQKARRKVDWFKYAKICSAEGCTKQAQKGGVCIRHGAKVKRCSSEGCTNQAQNGGVCIRHGAKRYKCSSEGCTNFAKRGGVCYRHGAMPKLCSSEGCTNPAINGEVCVKHGAKVVQYCRGVCTNQAQNQGDLVYAGLRHPKELTALSGLEHLKQSILSLMNEIQSQAFCHFVETNGLILPVVDSNFQVQDSRLFQSFVEEAQLALEKGEECGIGIAFHGTAECNIAPILREGLDPTKRRGQKHGPGEYFSPRPTLPIRFCRGGRQVLIFLVIYEPRDIRTKDIIVVNNTHRQLPIGTISFANTTSNAKAAADSFYEHVNELVQEKNKKEMIAREARSKEKIIRLLISGEYFAASDVYNNVCKNGSPSKVWADEVSLYVYDHIRNEEQICVYFPGLPSRPKEAAYVSSLNVVKCEEEAVQAREKYEKVASTACLHSYGRYSK